MLAPPIEVTFNDNDKKPEVEMSMKADVAHKFWFGKVNLVAALARRQMIAKGPVPKILKLPFANSDNHSLRIFPQPTKPHNPFKADEGRGFHLS